MTRKIGAVSGAHTNSAAAAAAPGGSISRAMHSNPEGGAQAYGIVISFAGTHKPLRRILDAEGEFLRGTHAA